MAGRNRNNLNDNGPLSLGERMVNLFITQRGSVLGSEITRFMEELLDVYDDDRLEPEGGGEEGNATINPRNVVQRINRKINAYRMSIKEEVCRVTNEVYYGVQWNVPSNDPILAKLEPLPKNQTRVAKGILDICIHNAGLIGKEMIIKYNCCMFLYLFFDCELWIVECGICRFEYFLFK